MISTTVVSLNKAEMLTQANPENETSLDQVERANTQITTVKVILSTVTRTPSNPRKGAKHLMLLATVLAMCFSAVAGSTVQDEKTVKSYDEAKQIISGMEADEGYTNWEVEENKIGGDWPSVKCTRKKHTLTLHGAASSTFTMQTIKIPSTPSPILEKTIKVILEEARYKVLKSILNKPKRKTNTSMLNEGGSGKAFKQFWEKALMGTAVVGGATCAAVMINEGSNALRAAELVEAGGTYAHNHLGFIMSTICFGVCLLLICIVLVRQLDGGNKYSTFHKGAILLTTLLGVGSIGYGLIHNISTVTANVVAETNAEDKESLAAVSKLFTGGEGGTFVWIGAGLLGFAIIYLLFRASASQKLSFVETTVALGACVSLFTTAGMSSHIITKMVSPDETFDQSNGGPWVMTILLGFTSCYSMLWLAYYMLGGVVKGENAKNGMTAIGAVLALGVGCCLSAGCYKMLMFSKVAGKAHQFGGSAAPELFIAAGICLLFLFTFAAYRQCKPGKFN